MVPERSNMKQQSERNDQSTTESRTLSNSAPFGLSVRECCQQLGDRHRCGTRFGGESCSIHIK